VDPEPVVASQESDSLSVISPHQQRRGGLAQPSQLPDTCRQAGPGSYPVQGGDVRYGSVCSVLVSEERLFRYQPQTYRSVQGCLQEYWRGVATRPEI